MPKDTFREIDKRMEQLGDLPIFSATVNRVNRVSNDQDSDAMALAVEVMKDANLTAKLIRLANSSYYNRGLGKITAVSRAVVLLGFETVSNLCLTLKLIDSFHTENPGIDMNALLVNAFLTGGLMREVAAKAGIDDIEQSYICGLLHGLGEIIVAYTLPEKYIDMQTLRDKGEGTWAEIQKKVLAVSFTDVGQRLAQSWEFPQTVVKTMEPVELSRAITKRDRKDLNRSMATLAQASLDLVYGRADDNNETLGELLHDMGELAGVPRSEIEKSLTKTFHTCCELANDYGLDARTLMPSVEETDDSLLNKTTRQFAYYVGTQAGINVDEDVEQASTPTSEDGKDSKKRESVKVKATAKEQAAMDNAPAIAETLGEKSAAVGDPQAQLEVLQQITGLISSQAGVHHVFGKVVEGIQRGVGFDRVILCLLSADHSQLIGRITYGDGVEVLKEYFNLPVRDQRNIFIRVMREGNEVLVSNVSDESWRSSVPEDYRNSVAAQGFMIGAIRAGNRPVGLLYADNGLSRRPISESEKQGFLQFINQGRLALQIAELNRG
jgi:HD-like signal output (HDOD) protein